MNTRRAPRLLFALLVLGMVALILRLRLAPFDFVWDGRIPWERATLAPLTMRDVPLNILLFAPLGFGLAGLLGGRGGAARRPWAVAAGTVALGVLFAAALEGAQFFLPERVPSLADVIANGLGALLGAALFNGWAMGVGRALRQYVTLRNWLIGLNIYMLAVFFFTVHLYRSVHLSNWDTSYPLVVGNEAVGRRQWSGRLEWLELQGHDDSAPIVFAIYDFAGESPFEDSSPLAIVPAPALVWSEGPVTPQDGEGVTVGPGEWLTTGSAFFDFSDYAREASYFTIDTRVATAARDQRGPARILSISADAEHRNVTLGQVGDDLIIRLRTPAAGENGQKPELLVPGVFADTQLRHITVNYDAPIMRVTVDETEEFVISLAPGAAFFPDFTTENRYQIVMDGDPHRYDLAYLAIVVGPAVVVFGSLGLAAWWARRAAPGR